MRIAINGIGVAGPTLAYWLRLYGHKPVLFEKAPALRRGGYVVDFWGSGYDVADRMQLIPDLTSDGYIIKELRGVNRQGRTRTRLKVKALQDLTQGRFLTIARSDLAARIFAACDGIAAHFGCAIAELDDDGAGVDVTLTDGRRDRFDLVIGADGLHSHIRTLAFGPQRDFERRTGLAVAAFMLPGYRPRDELTYVQHTLPHRQLSRIALRNDQTLILCVFATEAALPHDLAGQKALIADIYAKTGWEAPAILSRLDRVDELYLDRVSQIRMPDWSRGRVALLGDAAACASLLAGEGTGLAMTEAYVLAGELHKASGDYRAAFAAYHDRMGNHLQRKQDAALKFSGFFVPRSWGALFLRDLATNLAAIPFLTRWLVGASLNLDFTLPAYQRP
jgi:2-polyprenyl-6-methoxyphenol hydroxylase-like FAD-dependent oxidoreductase